MEQRNMTEEQAKKELSKRINHFLKTKNILHLKEKFEDNFEKMKDVMQEEAVTWEDIERGEAPDKVMELFKTLEHSRMVSESAFYRNLKEAKEKGELNKIAREYDREAQLIQTKEEAAQKVEQAKEKYAKHPTTENFAEVIKETMRGKEAVSKMDNSSPFAAGTQALRERLFNESVAAKKQLRKEMKEKGLPLDSTPSTGCNPYLHAFEDATSDAAAGIVSESTGLESAE